MRQCPCFSSLFWAKILATILKKHFVLHTLHCYAPILPPVVSNCYFLGNRFRQEALKSQWKFLSQNTTAKL
ncbi:unnamed protein product [Arabidopsis halleri]